MAKIRLTTNAIILVSIFMVLLSFATGILVWKTTGAPNLSPTDSDAAGTNTCEKNCNPYTVCSTPVQAKKCTDAKGKTYYDFGACGNNNPCRNNDLCPLDDPSKWCFCCNGANICKANMGGQSCGNYCNGKGGEGTKGTPSCESKPTPCTCKSYSGCGVDCTFPAGTQAQVDAAAKNSCGKAMAYCVMDDGGGTSIEIRTPGSCWDQRSVCKNPAAEETCVTETNPPACTSLAMALVPAAQSATNPLILSSAGGTISATLTASDPDGVPSKVRICYSIKGQSVEFYKTMTNWVCTEKPSAASMSISARSSEMMTAVATATAMTVAQVEAAGLTFMSEVYDNTDGKICTSNPGYATGGTSVIQGTATPCGGACNGAVVLAAKACGDGILDEGEECDPGAAAGSDAGSCTVGSCQADCTCPTLNPGFNIQKVPVQQCIEGKDIYSDVRYTITVTNNGTTVGHISQVTDDLDPKIQRDWIVQSSISPSEGVSIGAIADGPEGLEIIWTLDEASRTFDPGESMTFSYVVRIQQANFGNYRNVVTAIVTDEGEENVTATAVIDVSCLPGTGLFDSTMARIALASVLLIAGAYFAQSGRLDGVAFTLFTNAGQVEKKRTRFESKI